MGVVRGCNLFIFVESDADYFTVLIKTRRLTHNKYFIQTVYKMYTQIVIGPKRLQDIRWFDGSVFWS